MHKAVYKCLNLTEVGATFLHTVEQQMGIVADLSRADILLYGRRSQYEAIVLSHARPYSLAHVYLKNREGRTINRGRRPEVFRTFNSGKRQKKQRSTISEGAPVVREAFPIYYPHPFLKCEEGNRTNEKPRVIATLVIVTNLIEHERHRLRSRVFRKALRKLQEMLLYGQLHGAEQLPPFGEQDGIILTDTTGVIRYASGIATNLYRRLGYKETLVGRHLSALETEDEDIWQEAVAQNRCIVRETEGASRVWIRQVLPLMTYPPVLWRWPRLFHIFSARQKNYGVMMALHDATETRRQDEEIRVKNAMIQEVHHRVKNNLQTISSLLRMQARRVNSEEARSVLEETLNRILSVAVIHEFLSNNNSNIINIKEVSNRIISQFRQGMLSPDKALRLELTGEPIYLPARQATACSLIINELLQNAVEHGFDDEQAGLIRVNLEDNGEEVIIKVIDNGRGLPGDFQLEQADSLGWQIVKTLVEGDLKGQIDLSSEANNGAGLAVTITFSKTIFRGEEGWKKHVSL